LTIDQKEIWACAHTVMQRYGDAAAFHAAQRADELLLQNDYEGHRIWIHILRRIEDLEQKRPIGSVH
jgi:hypothetical protein